MYIVYCFGPRLAPHISSHPSLDFALARTTIYSLLYDRVEIWEIEGMLTYRKVWSSQPEEEVHDWMREGF